MSQVAELVWKESEGELKAFYGDVEATWAPQPGSQEAYLTCRVYEVLYEGTRGPGKGLPLDEPVYTPLGPTPIGKLKVGSIVLCPDGTRSKVIGVYPQGVRPVYKITFDDGAVAKCDDVHIWPIHVQGQKTKRVEYSYQLMGMNEVFRRFSKGDRLHIPTADRIEMMDPPRLKEWPIDPYMLGLLLGDGCFTQGRVLFCTMDDELADVAKFHGFKEGPKDKRNGLRNFVGSHLKKNINKLGLKDTNSHNKFVPSIYLNASRNVRISILQGLMDTDGYVDKKGYLEFCSTSKQLLKNVQYLARSLGAKCTCSGGNKLYIQSANKFEPFRLPRKQNKTKDYQHGVLWRRITHIEELNKQKTVCIKINHPLGLFITRDFVVTHNTDALIMDYARHVGRGYGIDWAGIIFRQTYPQLKDVIAKSKKWVPKIWPNARYNESQHSWTWPGGERLIFAFMKRPEEYYNYHGHAYPFIGWEEITTWPSADCYKAMMSCSRSTRRDMPRKYRATTNPYGPGHNWVKARWKLPILPNRIVGPIIKEPGLPERIAIRGVLEENKILMHAEPDYKIKLKAAARNESELKAWLGGDWDIIAGGMFDDIWNPSIHIVPDIPFNMIPRGWKIYRAYDHGSSKPFSVGWWAISNGEPIKIGNRLIGPIKGDLIRIAEWYGWDGKEPNQGVRMKASDIGTGIKEREQDWGIHHRVLPGPADSSIFDDYDPGSSVAGDMQAKGIRFEQADKGPGSRKKGWEKMRSYLSGSIPGLQGIREEAGMFICERCDQFKRTIPVLPRDDKDLDDVDTDAEDHIGDESRYMVRRKRAFITQRTTQ